MRIQNAWRTASRVLTQIAHDPRTLGLLLLVPSLLVGLMAWIFSDTPFFDQFGPAVL
ncbi:MAG: ABC transporter permease, partial [Microbacteriaceae bacterium]|nr:ABC transporter permease [Microbacteriaceae bacterium]